MPKKKLLFVMAAMNRGGAERSLINLLELLDQGKYEIDLLVFDHRGALMRQIPKGVHVLKPDREICFLSRNDIRGVFLNISLSGFFGRVNYMLAKRNRNNHVQCQKKWVKAFLPAVKPMDRAYDTAIAFMHSLPSYFVIDKVTAEKKILWVHNDYSTLMDGKDFDRKYFEAADCVVTVSEKCAAALKEVFPGLTEKIKCVYNLNPVEKIRIRAEAFYPPEYQSVAGTKLVSIGRLTRQKGFDYAVDAATQMRQKKIPFHWFIIGDGVQREILEKQIESQNVADCITLLGERENPYPYMKHADIVVQTSRHEGKSIALDEAKILCKPILCTDYLSVRDQIEDGVTGVIVKKDPTSLADGIIALIQQREKCDALCDRLKEEADRTKDVLKQYEEMFDFEDIGGNI